MLRPRVPASVLGTSCVLTSLSCCLHSLQATGGVFQRPFACLLSCEVKNLAMELHLFTSSAAIAAVESRWHEALKMSTLISSEDLELDIVSYCSMISSPAAVGEDVCFE